MIILNGNILEARENIICHQVNCQAVMGSGLAKQIRNKYPEVYTDYYNFCKTFDCAREKLLGNLKITICNDGKMVANLFGQFYYGRNLKQYTNYIALENSLKKLLKFINDTDYTVAFPYNLGCGLAGGNWNIVYNIIDNVFKNKIVSIYKYD